jgi:hypothetical protein
MDRLNKTYTRLAELRGEKIEPFEAVELVEQYRQYWRPDKVCVVLLAESHVQTSSEDMEIRLPSIDELPGYPTRYAKFVYCLAYGEKHLTRHGQHPPRDGTPQFWKIFFACANQVEANEDFAPIQSKTAFPERIANKIALLKGLRNRGVWLVDASISALYHGGEKPTWDKIEQAIRISWSGYTYNVVRECQPEHVIVIGKGVGRVVGASLERLTGGRYTIFPQPNARGYDFLEDCPTYYEICSRR